MKKKGLLVVISGPSGVGKGTVNQALRRNHPELAYSISATTRPPRAGETDGVQYYFLSPETFHQHLVAGDFLESAEVFGNCYGTLRQKVEEKLEQGQDVILEIDTQGALQVKKQAPEALLIFILPPSVEELERRLRGRNTESEEVIQRRLACAKGEMALAQEYHYTVVNYDFNATAQKIYQLILQEKATRV